MSNANKKTPPDDFDNPKARSPRFKTELYANKFAAEPDNGWTLTPHLTGSSLNNSNALFCASLSSSSIYSVPP